MVQTHNGFKKLRPMSNSKNNNKDSNSGTLSDLFKKWYTKGLEFVKNMFISAYDQRKLSFGEKLKTGVFTITNILSIGRVIIDCYRDGQSFKETLKYFKVEVVDEPSKSGKDFNDYLCEIKGINHKKKTRI